MDSDLGREAAGDGPAGTELTRAHGVDLKLTGAAAVGFQRAACLCHCLSAYAPLQQRHTSNYISGWRLLNRLQNCCLPACSPAVNNYLLVSIINF